MNVFKKMSVFALSLGISFLALGGVVAFAQQPTAEFSLTPQSTQNGKTDYILTLDRSTLPPASAILKFEIADGVTVQQATAGSGIESSEFSYNVVDGLLILLYLDNDAGGSPLSDQSQIATITLQQDASSVQTPLTCIVTDVCGMQGSDILNIDTQVTAKPMQNGSTGTVDSPSTSQPAVSQSKADSPTPNSKVSADSPSSVASAAASDVSRKSSVRSSAASKPSSSDSLSSQPSNPSTSSVSSDVSTLAESAGNNTSQPAPASSSIWGIGVLSAALIALAGYVVYRIKR